MEPLSNRQCGPEWFRKPFLNPSGQDERDIHDTLLACFQPTSLWTRLTSFKSGIKADAYQPNLVAIKFGLSQLLPKSLVPQAKVFFFYTHTPNERWLESCQIFCKRKDFSLVPLNWSSLTITPKSLRNDGPFITPTYHITT